MVHHPRRGVLHRQSPGFVWTDRLRLAPLPWIDARDLLAAGRGSMRVNLRSPKRSGTRRSSPAVLWEAIDDEGKLLRLTATRYRDLGGGRSVLTPWTGRSSEYRDFGGFRVPASVEVSSLLDSGEFTHARLRVTSID